MSTKPIFVATHPRACSTAFERVFMTRHDILQCVHEPFGDAYYYGPERLADRFADDKESRVKSGFSESTYQTIMDRINRENTEGKRVFIKDMAQYFIPPDLRPVSLAPSLLEDKNGNLRKPKTVRRPSHIETSAPAIDPQSPSDRCTPYPTPSEPGNPTVVPSTILEQFHWTFLIRHPRSSIPSYYRCTIPPLDKLTGFYSFRSDEAGYNELRRMFDYLRKVGHIGPAIEGREDQANGVGSADKSSKVKICVIDADDLLDKPNEVIQAFCNNVGIDYSPDMLKWDQKEDSYAEKAFEKWKGFHEDAIQSSDLKPRQHKKKVKTDDEYYKEWEEKYGKDGADVIRKTVADCVPDYEYLRQFCVKV